MVVARETQDQDWRDFLFKMMEVTASYKQEGGHSGERHG